MKYEWTFGAATFKRRLIHLMEEKGLSQIDVAEFAGVSQGTVSRWLAGSKPVLEKVTALASGAGVDLAWLAHGEGRLKIAHEGIDGFIHRAKTRVIPRLNEVRKKLDDLVEADFLPHEDREIIEEIGHKLNSRRLHLVECVAALEKLPADDDPLARELLSKIRSGYDGPDVPSKRQELCWLFDLTPYATDQEILDACRSALEKNPRPRLAARKSDLLKKQKPK